MSSHHRVAGVASVAGVAGVASRRLKVVEIDVARPLCIRGEYDKRAGAQSTILSISKLVTTCVGTTATWDEPVPPVTGDGEVWGPLIEFGTVP